MPRWRSEVTELLDRWTDGDPEALSRLMPLVVNDLRHVARKQLAREMPGHTLEPTALVNEVYLRLVGRRAVTWRNRAQFFAFAAGLMRQILVDHARRRSTAKRGKDAIRVSFDETIALPSGKKDPQLLDLDDALQSLEAVDPRQGRIVEMRYFTGLTVEEIAEAEGISPTTVKREWRTARMWLSRELQRGQSKNAMLGGPQKPGGGA